jgi:hypothetical protein
MVLFQYKLLPGSFPFIGSLFCKLLGNSGFLQDGSNSSYPGGAGIWDWEQLYLSQHKHSMHFACRPVDHWVCCFKEGISKDNVIFFNVCNQEPVGLTVVFMGDLHSHFFCDFSQSVVCPINIANLSWSLQFVSEEF